MRFHYSASNCILFAIVSRLVYEFVVLKVLRFHVFVFVVVRWLCWILHFFFISIFAFIVIFVVFHSFGTSVSIFVRQTCTSSASVFTFKILARLQLCDACRALLLIIITNFMLNKLLNIFHFVVGCKFHRWLHAGWTWSLCTISTFHILQQGGKCHRSWLLAEIWFQRPINVELYLKCGPICRLNCAFLFILTHIQCLFLCYFFSLQTVNNLKKSRICLVSDVVRTMLTHRQIVDWPIKSDVMCSSFFNHSVDAAVERRNLYYAVFDIGTLSGAFVASSLQSKQNESPCSCIVWSHLQNKKPPVINWNGILTAWAALIHFLALATQSNLKGKCYTINEC